jgi:Domain of unknown function (DUF397)
VAIGQPASASVSGRMTNTNPVITDSELSGLEWRTSSFGAASGDCVEVARLPDGRTALRNRRFPEKGAVVFTPAEMSAWIKGCKAGEFDDIGQTR